MPVLQLAGHCISGHETLRAIAQNCEKHENEL